MIFYRQFSSGSIIAYPKMHSKNIIPELLNYIEINFYKMLNKPWKPMEHRYFIPPKKVVFIYVLLLLIFWWKYTVEPLNTGHSRLPKCCPLYSVQYFSLYTFCSVFPKNVRYLEVFVKGGFNVFKLNPIEVL